MHTSTLDCVSALLTQIFARDIQIALSAMSTKPICPIQVGTKSHILILCQPCSTNSLRCNTQQQQQKFIDDKNEKNNCVHSVFSSHHWFYFHCSLTNRISVDYYYFYYPLSQKVCCIHSCCSLRFIVLDVR